jgi:tetratricopeptide (TPR) repeat protein
MTMHSLNDLFQCLYNDLNEIFTIDCAPNCQPKTAVRDRPLRTLTDYNRAIQLAPTDAKLFYRRGIIRQQARDHRGAIADLDRAIELDPRFAKAYTARSASFTHIARLSDALTDSDRAIALNPDLESAYATRAVARSYSGDNNGAIADFTRCTQLNPRATTYYNLGVSQLAIDLYAPALASLAKSIDLQPELATYYARSVALAGLGDDFGSNRDYSEALSRETPGSGSLYPSDEHAYYFRALARLARGQREDAKSDLAIAIDICDRKQNGALRHIAQEKIAQIDRG